MNAFLIALIVIAGLFALFFIIKFIRFLFTNFWTSRILSTINAVLALFLSIPLHELLVQTQEFGDRFVYVIPLAILMTFAWLFFDGDNIFDVTWDGVTYDVEEVNETTVRVSPHEVGGFFGNMFGAFLVIGAAFLFLAKWQPIFIILPLLIIILNTISFVKMAKSRKK